MPWFVAALLFGAWGSQANTPGAAGSAALAPRVIYWFGAGPAERKHPTEVGLLYTPEVLAALARSSPAFVSERINDAIRHQTAIVVLWTIPPIAGEPPVPRPFSAVIVEHGDYGSVPRTEPLWIEQHADDIRQLDPQRRFQEVGVMAGFERSAFVAGHSIIIYRQLPPSELGASRYTQRFGRIRRLGRCAATGCGWPASVTSKNGVPSGRGSPFLRSAPYLSAARVTHDVPAGQDTATFRLCVFQFANSDSAKFQRTGGSPWLLRWHLIIHRRFLPSSSICAATNQLPDVESPGRAFSRRSENAQQEAPAPKSAGTPASPNGTMRRSSDGPNKANSNESASRRSATVAPGHPPGIGAWPLYWIVPGELCREIHLPDRGMRTAAVHDRHKRGVISRDRGIDATQTRERHRNRDRQNPGSSARRSEPGGQRTGEHRAQSGVPATDRPVRRSRRRGEMSCYRWRGHAPRRNPRHEPDDDRWPYQQQTRDPPKSMRFVRQHWAIEQERRAQSLRKERRGHDGVEAGSDHPTEPALSRKERARRW